MFLVARSFCDLNVDCKFEKELAFPNGAKYISCVVNNMTVTSKNQNVNFNMTNCYKGLSISNQVVHFLPADLHIKFKELRGLMITKSQVQEITRNSMRLEQLYILDLSGNELKTLDENLFDDCKELTRIYLKDNQIHFIDSTAFSGIKLNIEYLDLSNNTCYNVSVSFNNDSTFSTRTNTLRLKNTCNGNFPLYSQLQVCIKRDRELSEVLNLFENMTITLSNLNCPIIFDNNCSKSIEDLTAFGPHGTPAILVLLVLIILVQLCSIVCRRRSVNRRDGNFEEMEAENGIKFENLDASGRKFSTLDKKDDKEDMDGYATVANLKSGGKPLELKESEEQVRVIQEVPDEGIYSENMYGSKGNDGLYAEYEGDKRDATGYGRESLELYAEVKK